MEYGEMIFFLISHILLELNSPLIEHKPSTWDFTFSAFSSALSSHISSSKLIILFSKMIFNNSPDKLD